MDCIIFSRDRACQLDLLLRSVRIYYRHWNLSKFSILYKHTSSDFKKGYSLAKSIHSEFNWVEEQNFRNDIIKLLDSSKFDKLMFLMDDNIFIRCFDSECKEILELSQDKDLACVSLRYFPGMTYCYTTNQNIKVPHLTKDLKWEWRGQDAAWDYPMSQDGHIFRTSQIVPWIKQLKWTSPNSKEAAMDAWAKSNHIVPPKMSCFAKAKIVNIVSNRVNVDAPNRIPNAPTDTQQLNCDFLNGKRIKLPIIRDHNACHIEHEYVYE